MVPVEGRSLLKVQDPIGRCVACLLVRTEPQHLDFLLDVFQRSLINTPQKYDLLFLVLLKNKELPSKAPMEPGFFFFHLESLCFVFNNLTPNNRGTFALLRGKESREGKRCACQL